MPFGSLEDFEHLMIDDGAENWERKKLKGKEKNRNKIEGTMFKMIKVRRERSLIEMSCYNELVTTS